MNYKIVPVLHPASEYFTEKSLRKENHNKYANIFKQLLKEEEVFKSFVL